jgi:hypothetical protein
MTNKKLDWGPSITFLADPSPLINYARSCKFPVLSLEHALQDVLIVELFGPLHSHGAGRLEIAGNRQQV